MLEIAPKIALKRQVFLLAGSAAHRDMFLENDTNKMPDASTPIITDAALGQDEIYFGFSLVPRVSFASFYFDVFDPVVWKPISWRIEMSLTSTKKRTTNCGRNTEVWLLETGASEKKEKSERLLWKRNQMEENLAERSQHPPPHVPVQWRVLVDGLSATKGILRKWKWKKIVRWHQQHGISISIVWSPKQSRKNLDSWRGKNKPIYCRHLCNQTLQLSPRLPSLFRWSDTLLRGWSLPTRIRWGGLILFKTLKPFTDCK